MLEETEAEETDSDYSSGVDIDKVIKLTCYSNVRNILNQVVNVSNAPEIVKEINYIRANEKVNHQEIKTLSARSLGDHVTTPGPGWERYTPSSPPTPSRTP